MQFRVFIGDWDDDKPGVWTHLDRRALSWDEAKAILADSLRGYETENWPCPHCRYDAAEGLKRLLSAEPGQFETEVDGNDYLILVDGQLA